MFGLTKRMLIVIGLVVVVALLLIVQNNKKGSAQPAGSSSGGCQVQVTADVLNIRSGPDDTANVVGKLTTGAVTGAQNTIQNGYRELGTGRWASSEFLKAVSGAC